MISPFLLDAPLVSSASAKSSVTTADAARRALLFFLSHQDSYRKPLFSTQEIFCGPDTERRSNAGKITALNVPVGEPDMRDVLAQLPAAQTPDFVVVKADATGRNFPRNVSAVKGQKVLLVGDTHHFGQPLQKLIRYAQTEAFDYVIFDHTRHHARFFAEAGLRNLFWMPALDYGFVQRDLRAKPSHALTFVGQAGKHHPFRCSVLQQVQAAGLPLEILRGRLTETADLYADSQVTLNISLNGDLNLRVFESLAAGGFLLTDELAPDSGLSRLFEAGKHLDTWRSTGELIEKIRHYLAHPAEAARIRREGQAEVLRNHHPSVKLREFYALLDNGEVNSRYDLTQEAWWPRGTTVVSPGLPSRLASYETLQELHRTAGAATIFTDAPEELSDFANLPRLKLAPLAELRLPATVNGLSEQHVLAWNETTTEETLTRFGGNYLLAQNAEAAKPAVLADWGFAPMGDAGILRLDTPMLFLNRAWAAGAHENVRARLAATTAAVKDSADCLTLANYAEQLGDVELQGMALQRAIGLDRGNQIALLSLAGILLERGDVKSTAMIIEEAARLAPLPEEIDELRQNLTTQAGEQPEVATYLHTIGRGTPELAAKARKILLVTNLFPPQELGGYGRMMWEFAHGLRVRGHEVRILAADQPQLGKTPTADEVELEQRVDRSLEMFGTWQDGKPVVVSDPAELAKRAKANAKLVRTAIHHRRPDVVLAGNLDFLGLGPVQAALTLDVPVLHAVANAGPGYDATEQPSDLRYWAAPCSNWNGAALRQGGYFPTRMETLYPGARVDRFFRLFLPDTARLRICYASLVMPYKGAHVLVEALAQLHAAGVDFSAEIAGDTPDASFREKLLDVIVQRGMADKVKLTGFLDRHGLAEMFGRSNVLVFPSQFPEPFGISQVEAMAGGLVVVSSGTGGAREIVRHGTDGLLFDAANPNDLANKLYSLAGDQEQFTKLQTAAQRRAVTLSVENAVKRIEQLVDEMTA